MADWGPVNESDVFSEEGRIFFADVDLPLPTTDRQLIETDQTVIESLDEQVARLQRGIDEIAATRLDTRLAMTIPGIGPFLLTTFLAELGEPERIDKYVDRGSGERDASCQRWPDRRNVGDLGFPWIIDTTWGGRAAAVLTPTLPISLMS